MPHITSGVKNYVTLTAEITVNFPVDIRGNFQGNCEHCPYYSPTANRCNITRDPCTMPKSYVNGTCPFLNQFPMVNPATGEVLEDDLK